MLAALKQQHADLLCCCCAGDVAVCLQELLAIQQNDGPKNLGFFGTRNMGMTHQKLVEILSYAMVSTVSAYTGTHHHLLCCAVQSRAVQAYQPASSAKQQPLCQGTASAVRMATAVLLHLQLAACIIKAASYSWHESFKVFTL
jgi:hypothetical protein